MLRRTAAVVTAVVSALGGALAPVPTARASTSDGHLRALPTIKGTVGPTYDIWINETSVPAGRYRLIVRDRGTIHNFHFFGDGVNRETSVPDTGRTVWRVTLSPGTYYAICVPHGSMSTQLEVT